MKDSFGRDITYLRISVTDRCNLRCVYCMPEEGIPLLHHNHILSYDRITSFVRTAVDFGITKVRLTGGEPLVRKDITTLVAQLAALPGITDLAMTTNAQALAPMARALKDAGLRRLNISLDTVDPTTYAQWTRGGSLQKVFDGIQAAKDAGFGTPDAPIKLNCVWFAASTQAHLEALQKYAQQEGLQLRRIHCMDLSRGQFTRVEGGDGGDCAHCNRLRLTATGLLKPCLFSNLSYKILQLGAPEVLRQADQEVLRQAIVHKPEKGLANTQDAFYTVGG